MTAVEAVDLKEHRPRFSRRRTAAAGGCAVYIYVEVFAASTASPCSLNSKKKKIEAAGSVQKERSVRFSRLPTASQPQLPLPLHWRATRHHAGGAAAVHCGSTSGCEIVNTLLSWGVLALKAEERLRKGRGCC